MNIAQSLATAINPIPAIKKKAVAIGSDTQTPMRLDEFLGITTGIQPSRIKEGIDIAQRTAQVPQEQTADALQFRRAIAKPPQETAIRARTPQDEGTIRGQYTTEKLIENPPIIMTSVGRNIPKKITNDIIAEEKIAKDLTNLENKEALLDKTLVEGRNKTIDKWQTRIKAEKEIRNSPRSQPKNDYEISLQKVLDENNAEFRGTMVDPDNGDIVVNFIDKEYSHDLPMSMYAKDITPQNIKLKIQEKYKAVNKPKRLDDFLKDK